MPEAPVALHLLFLCTGNYYRSRFAAGLFNHLAASAHLPWRAFSRGLGVIPQAHSLAPETVAACHRLGIDPALCGRGCTPLTEADLHRAARIIAVDHLEHSPMVAARFPDWAGGVTYWDCRDLAFQRPEDSLGRCERHVRTLVAALAKACPQA